MRKAMSDCSPNRSTARLHPTSFANAWARRECCVLQQYIRHFFTVSGVLLCCANPPVFKQAGKPWKPRYSAQAIHISVLLLLAGISALEVLYAWYSERGTRCDGTAAWANSRNSEEDRRRTGEYRTCHSTSHW